MNLVKRAEWGARSPRQRLERPLSNQSTGHWNGDKITIGGSIEWDHSRCASLVRGVQNFHMDGRGWSDIAYNFLECPHGYTFEGRGLNVVNAANGTNAANQSSHAIMCLAGEGNPFPDAEKFGFREAVRYISEFTDAPDDAIGHRDHKATACPGNERYNWIRQGMPIVSGGDRVLKLGMRGDDVRRVQTIIHDKAGGNLFVDGIFGPNTELRVKQVQAFFGLAADGVVGTKTWEILKFLEAAPVPARPFGDWPYVPKPTLTIGTTGDVVAYLQRVIDQKAGGGIQVDGNFGPATEIRVRELQKFFGLLTDGVVGPKTWGIIDFLASS